MVEIAGGLASALVTNTVVIDANQLRDLEVVENFIVT